MTFEQRQGFMETMLDDQARGFSISPETHERLIQLVDQGILGMDGFKYCWPEVATENRRRLLESMEYRRRRTA
jgi:hypothetical protein